MQRFDVIIEIGARREPDPYQKTGEYAPAKPIIRDSRADWST